MTNTIKQPPPRKEPGLFGKSISVIIRFFCGLVAALFVSLLIEWAGMVFIWPDQGERHAQEMYNTEKHYLDKQFIQCSRSLGRSVFVYAQRTNQWINHQGNRVLTMHAFQAPTTNSNNRVQQFTTQIIHLYRPYFVAAIYITQLFFVRLSILVLFFPVFSLFLITGLIDGLVERHLRRLGGGRESSNVYNLARKSVFPTLMIACVIYISLPVSVHPALFLMPFSLLTGLSIRITFEKLKKHF